MTEAPPEPPPDDLFAALGRASDDEGVAQRRQALKAALLGPPPAARRFGRFIELGLLGRGGMGEVYEAYDPTLDRKVAIKLVRRDMTQHHRRLEREAMALARLQHPNVVQIYEVGHLDGRLFLAMELVQGDTLHGWQQRPHGWRECVDVYLGAGHGLAAAHDAGLVHRDFKPANCIRDTSGRVRVLDFGLVRAAEGPEQTEGRSMRSGVIGSSDAAPPPAESDPSVIHVEPTQTGSLVGTKTYMAPECFDAQASERSDQYSFCVALYQALCGRLPFGGDAGRAAPRHAFPPPGASVPRWLQRALERGLQEDPAQRWPSMDGLLDALERGRGRRARMGGISLAIAAVGGLVVGLTVRLAEPPAMKPPCDDAREQLVGTWDQALRTKVRDSLRATTLAHAEDTWVRVEPMLDRYAEAWVGASTEACVESRTPSDRPGVLSHRRACLRRGRHALQHAVRQLVSADAKTVDGAVMLVAQLPSIERCVGIDAPERSAPPPEVAQDIEALRDELEDARAFDALGKYSEGLARVGPVLVQAEELGDETLLAEAWQVQGQLQLDAGDHDSARVSLRHAYTEATRLGLLEVELEALTGLIYVLGVAGTDTQGALMLGIRPAAVLTNALGDREIGDVLAAEVLTTVAQVHTTAGELEPARRGFAQALAVLDDRQRDGLLAQVRPLEGLAQLERRQGRPERAKALSEQAVEIREQWLGPRHPATVHSLIQVCGAAEVPEKCQRGIDILEQQTTPDHGWLGHAHHTLGAVLSEQHRLPEAAAELREAITSLELARDGQSTHPELPEAHANLGYVLEQQGLVPAAIAEHRVVLELLHDREPTPANRLLEAKTLRSLGELELARGRAEPAAQHHCQALAIYEAQLGHRDLKLARVLHGLAEALAAQGRPAPAEAALERALAIYAATPEPPPEAFAEAQRLRAELRGARSEPRAAVLDEPPCP
jgi:tetratricopeptide (TPR) repeat protein